MGVTWLARSGIRVAEQDVVVTAGAHAALIAACAAGPVVPVYVLDDETPAHRKLGGASRWWLHHSLASLDAALRERGSRLLLAKGESGAVLRSLVKKAGAGAVYWNRRYEPAIIARDKVLKADLLAEEVDARSFNASLLFEPHTVQNKSGGPFQVFTPFWRHCLTLPVDEPVKLPRGDFPVPAAWPASPGLAELELLPAIKWDAGLAAAWVPGEAAAMKRLKQFTTGAMADYADRRNLPDVDGTSALSPYLHFGEIGPVQLVHRTRRLVGERQVTGLTGQIEHFVRELGWREFSHHLLFHYPATTDVPMYPKYAAFPWRDPADYADDLRAWQRGRTGVPIVDAGMRQLWTTGWMHNRVRMIVASFLTKNLLIPWQEGARWFWDTLVDASLPQNSLGWQWAAGCGADAAPYFRIFNPVLQSAKFDGGGRYLRHWVPEIARLPDVSLHAPWEAKPAVWLAAKFSPGQDYPKPIVSLSESRDRALAAYARIKGADSTSPLL